MKEEIENFITSNCKKIEKNIWLCPLSGKKFKGPDYVRKHIETKHMEKLEELKRFMNLKTFVGKLIRIFN